MLEYVVRAGSWLFLILLFGLLSTTSLYCTHCVFTRGFEIHGSIVDHRSYASQISTGACLENKTRIDSVIVIWNTVHDMHDRWMRVPRSIALPSKLLLSTLEALTLITAQSSVKPRRCCCCCCLSSHQGRPRQQQ